MSSSQLKDIQQIISKQKCSYYIHDNNTNPLSSSTKLILSKTCYIKEIDIFMYGRIVKNYIIFAWGETDTTKIYNDFLNQLEEKI